MTKRPHPSNNSLQFDVLSVPESQHDEFRSEARASATAILEDLPSTFATLLEYLKRLDCTSVLASFAYFGLRATIDEQGHQEEVRKDILQHHAELLQAVALTITPTNWHGEPCINDLNDIFKILKTLSNAPLASYLTADIEKRDGALHVEELLVRMRLTTQGVRNWDYYTDAITNAKILYGPLAPLLTPHFGFDIVDLVTLASKAASIIQDRLEKHLRMLAKVLQGRTEREQMELYFELNPRMKGTPDEVLEALAERSVKAEMMIISHSSLLLPQIYTFDIPTLATESGLSVSVVSSVLSTLSMKPGDLADCNTEYFFLNNPVWSRPIVDIGSERFFVPVVQMIFSHLHLVVKRLAETAGVT